MERTKTLFRIAIAIAVTFINHVAYGQQNNSLYFLDRVPQSIQLNPALQPSSTFFFGFPLTSTIEINAGNNALGINDILIQDKELDMPITPLYSKDISTQTLNKLKKNNIFSTSAQIDIISFGFKIKDSYVSFLISEKANVNTNISKDLAQFVYEGIDVGKSYAFDMNFNANYYREYSISYSQKISDRIYFGVRGKMLFGKVNISSSQSNISLNEPNWQTIEMSSSVKMNTSIPNMKVYTDATGKLDSTDVGDFSPSEILNDFVFLNKNKGFAFDLGFQFYLNEKVALSASVLDLGYINWKSNVNTLSGGGDFSFHGINLNNDDSIDVAEALLDTLQNVYDLSVTTNPYNTLLTPKLYAALSYTPNRFIKLGLLARSEYMFKTFRQQVTGSLTLYPTQLFGTTISYTVADRLYDNLGVGLVFRGGPLQMYFMSERIPLFWNKVKNSEIPYLPIYAKDVNFRMGINFVFGANMHRKLKKDQPFLE